MSVVLTESVKEKEFKTHLLMHLDILRNSNGTEHFNALAELRR